MRNFTTYFNIYKENKSRVDGEFITKRIPTIIPFSSQTNIEAVKFFAGSNVCTEEIDTCNGFSYKAVIRTADQCDEEFENVIKSGLEELGLHYKHFSLKRVRKYTTQNQNRDFKYEISIGLS